MRDLDVRGHVHRLLNERFQYDPSTVIVDELGICQGKVRVDVAAVNGDLYGFEIKAAADTLKRLDGQVEAYSRVVDFAAVVTAEKHAAEAIARLPAWWGVYLATYEGGQVVVQGCRVGERNPTVDVRAVSELLWHSETLELLKARDALHGVRSKPRKHAWDRLCETYSLDEIRHTVRSRLKERKADRSASQRE